MRLGFEISEFQFYREVSYIIGRTYTVIYPLHSMTLNNPTYLVDRFGSKLDYVEG